MKTIKVAEATGIVLDWLVLKALGFLRSDVIQIYAGGLYAEGLLPNGYCPASESVFDIALHGMRYSTDWSLGGPIIEAELLDVTPYDPGNMGWRCTRRDADYSPKAHPLNRYYAQFGPTPLIAAMRCYVSSRLGDVVEVPEKLE